MIHLPQNHARSRTFFPRHQAVALALLALAFLSLSGSRAPAKPGQGGPPRTTGAWATEVSKAEDKESQHWSVLVKDLNTGEVIFNHNANDRLVPASNRKLLVFALAMDKLGPEFRFRTELGYTGKLDRATGTVNGTLVLRSNGDPTMESRYLNEKNPAAVLRGWIDGMVKSGIKKIDGDCIIDASAFGPEQDSYPDAWDDSHRNYSYAMLPSAIAFNQNLLHVMVRPSDSSGTPGRPKFFPSDDGIAVDNDTRTVGGGAEGLDARFSPDGRTLRLSGRIGSEVGAHAVNVPLATPVQIVRAITEYALKDEGLRITGKVKIITDPARARELGTLNIQAWHESIPLVELLRIMLRNSDNFIAEQVWHATAFRALGDGSTLSARKLEQTWYAEHKLPWIEPGYDGCGLSRKNGIAAAEEVAVLESVYTSPYQKYLLDCLPASGRSGTLRGRSMGGDPGRILAKTGTLSGVMALAGFIRDAKGKPRWVFSMLSNAPKNTNGALVVRADQFVKILLDLMDSGEKPVLSPPILMTDKKYRPGTKTLMGNPS